MFIKNIYLSEEEYEYGKFFFLGDTHYGTKAFDEISFQKALTRMNSFQGRHRKFLMGDIFETTTIRHPYYNIKLTNSTPLHDQYKEFLSKFQQDLRNTEMVLDGNHEIRVIDIINFSQLLADDLDASYGTYAAVARIHAPDGGWLFNIYLTHGRKSLSTSISDPAYKELALRRMLMKRLQGKMHDCVVMGRAHTHRLVVQDPTEELRLWTTEESKVKGIERIIPGDQHYIPPASRWYFSIGGFVRMYVEGYNTYLEIGDHEPLSLGYVELTISQGEIEYIKPISMI